MWDWPAPTRSGSCKSGRSRFGRQLLLASDPATPAAPLCAAPMHAADPICERGEYCARLPRAALWFTSTNSYTHGFGHLRGWTLKSPAQSLTCTLVRQVLVREPAAPTRTSRRLLARSSEPRSCLLIERLRLWRWVLTLLASTGRSLDARFCKASTIGRSIGHLAVCSLLVRGTNAPMGHESLKRLPAGQTTSPSQASLQFVPIILLGQQQFWLKSADEISAHWQLSSRTLPSRTTSSPSNRTVQWRSGTSIWHAVVRCPPALLLGPRENRRSGAVWPVR